MHTTIRIKRLPMGTDNTEKQSKGSSLDEIITAKLREIRRNVDRHRDKSGQVHLHDESVQEIQTFLDKISVPDTLPDYEYYINPSKRRRC